MPMAIPGFQNQFIFFSSPPFIQVSGLCEKFIETIDDHLQSEDISWERSPENGNGGAVVLDSLFIAQDIERDLRKGAWIIII